MNPAPVGTKVRVTNHAPDSHSYVAGKVYRVVRVDTDGTFKAEDESGKVGGWISWQCCERAEPSTWDRIAAALPEDLAIFLSCFDKIDQISLDEHVIDLMLGQMPNLHERILAFAKTPDGAALIAGNRPKPIPQRAAP